MQIAKSLLGRLNSKIYPIGLGLILIIFAIFKLSYLKLGCYWDETWPFSYAIYQLHEHWPLILPNTIDPYITRGHPLLFHFLVSTWMTIFGDSLIVAKTFPLLLSLLTLVAIYKFGELFFSQKAGLLAAALLAVQAVFYSQSTLLLLEVQLTLFTILTFLFYFKKKRFLYILFGSFAILTKETGITVIAALGIWHLVNYVVTIKSTKFKDFLIEGLWIITPIAVSFLYFVLQRILNGWFLFPIHVGFMSFDHTVILDKFEHGLYLIFKFQDKKLITIFASAALIIAILLRSLTLSKKQWQIIHLLFWFLLVFNIFGSLNYLSDRYYLPAIALFIFTAAVLISKVAKNNYVWFLFAVIIIGISTKYLINDKGLSDTDKGYKDVVKVHQKAINYLIENNLQNKNIYTHFILREAMKATYPGYIKDEKDCFKSFHYEFVPFYTDLCIFSNVEYSPDFDEIRKNHPLSILAEFYEGDAFTFIFKSEYPAYLNSNYDSMVSEYGNVIKADSNWLALIKKEANDKKIDLKVLLNENARYMVAKKLQPYAASISLNKRRTEMKKELFTDSQLIHSLIDSASSKNERIDTIIERYIRKQLK